VVQSWPRGTLAWGVLAAFAISAAAAQPIHGPDAEPDQPGSEPAAPPTPQPKPSEVTRADEVETELTLIDGRRITGVLVDQSKAGVTLRVAGIQTPFARSTISKVRTLPSVEEQYKSLRSRAKDLDFLERLKIADWLRSRERFDLAMVELDGILALDPRNYDAADLRTRVLLEQDLASRRLPPGTAPKPKEPKVEKESKEFPLLDDDQINLLRVFEADLNANPRLSISRETIDRLIETYGGHDGIPTTREGRDAFRRKPPVEILAILFRLRARELYSDVKMLDHPPSLRRFRDDVHNSWLLNSCATTACHAGPDAGRLYLANKGSPPDRVVYTNFLILDRFKMSDGRPLIDYDHPAESPLLQLALPRGAAGIRHSEATVGKNKVRWRSVLSGPDDPRFRKSVQWIESMYRPRPDYPIDYQPPKALRTDDSAR
jgi:hypothetical protein